MTLVAIRPLPAWERDRIRRCWSEHLRATVPYRTLEIDAPLFCEEPTCRGEIVGRKPGARFCSERCRKRFNNRNETWRRQAR